MPEMDGFVFLNHLKRDSATKDIPILIVTGENSSASKEGLMLSGAVDVLVKPVSAETLSEAIRKAISLDDRFKTTTVLRRKQR